MMNIGAWILDERKFFASDELLRLRRSVRRRVERAGFRKRLPWLEWFLVELALETGLRVMEMSSLRCSDLVLGVSRCGVLVRRGKGGKPRYVRVRQAFARDCREFLAWKAAVGEPLDDDAAVFLSSATKTWMTTRGLQKMFKRSCRRVGIANKRMHDTRHTYASNLLRAGKFNLRLVQRQLGHASIRTTEVYAHVFDEDTDRAVEKLYA